MRRALLTGVTGQDGSYLAELLLDKGYEVHGIMRRSSSFNTARVDHIYDHPQFKLHFGDLTDGGSLERVLHDVQPHEVYNLGAQSHVRVSFDMPEYTCDTVGMGVLRLLEAVRRCCPEARVYQASSSEMFGASPPPQSEATPFYPRSPYACAKVFAFNFARNYREGYGMFVCNGILFNHESERRGETFVTRKITLAAARIKTGQQRRLALGNLDARRDWGYAPEYMEAAWRMLQQDAPDDYVVATGETHPVEEFVDAAFAHAGLDWHQYVETDPRYFRPTEVDALCGDASKARRVLGWKPTTTFAGLVRIMVDADLEAVGGKGIK